jgi:regulatory protein YycI of two-component signal transduction system YycFG
MLWERAKNLIVLFLLLLNGLLAFLLYQEQNRYILSTEREKAIISVLGQNKMTMYSEIIRKFPPMYQLRLSGYAYNTDALRTLFFGSPENSESVDVPDMEVYESIGGRLSISNGYITYERIIKPGDDKASEPVTQAHAKEICEVFIKQNYPEYILDDIANDGVLEATPEGYLRLTYRQKYNGKIIHRNFIEFLVTGNGIEEIEMQYGAVVEYYDEAIEICAPDEALLTFIQHIRSVYGSQPTPVIIDNMDIVYNQEEFSVQKDAGLTAVPFYRVFVRYNYVPFLINAYTNVCIN